MEVAARPYSRLFGSYQFLTSSDKPVGRGAIHNVWHKSVPSKVSMFAWRLVRERISTKNNLARRCVLQPNDNLCVGGCGNIETADHLFIGWTSLVVFGI